MTEFGDINFKKRAKMLSHLHDAPSGFKAIVTDMSRGFITEGDSYVLDVSTLG